MGNCGLYVNCLWLCLVVSRLSVHSYNENIHQGIQSLRENQLGLVETENGLLPNTEVYQQNEQLVNEIYFGYLENGNLDSTQVSALENIATQCPLSGGVAVYLARGLVAKYLPDLEYDDETVCLQVGLQYRQSQPVKPENVVIIKPNPTNEVVEISGLSGETELFLSDLAGKKLLTVFTDKEGYIKVSTHNLANGVYFLYWLSTDNTLQSEKIVIIH